MPLHHFALIGAAYYSQSPLSSLRFEWLCKVDVFIGQQSNHIGGAILKEGVIIHSCVTVICMWMSRCLCTSIVSFTRRVARLQLFSCRATRICLSHQMETKWWPKASVWRGISWANMEHIDGLSPPGSRGGQGASSIVCRRYPGSH